MADTGSVTAPDCVGALAPCARAAAERGLLRVGLLGCGVVGGALARALAADASTLRKVGGVSLEVRAVAVKRPDKRRPVDVSALVTVDPWRVALDPEIDVVVETIGGREVAYELVLAALRDGKSVVTANKELVAAHGDELTRLASRRGVLFAYDAAVGGGAPVLDFVRGIRTSGLRKITGILNGTTNYVLSKVRAEGTSVDEALAEAQRLGFAEGDVRRDVSGEDSAAKTAILAAAAFDVPLDGTPVPHEGISTVTVQDVLAARDAGCVVKLVSHIELAQEGVRAHVSPAALPESHPLARVDDCHNGVTCVTDTGTFTLTGPGAGGAATAGAIVADLASIARAYRAGLPSA